MTSTTLLLLYNDFCRLPLLHLYRQTYYETNQIFMLTCDTSLSQHVWRAFPLVTSRVSRRCVAPHVYSVTQSKSSGQQRLSQHNFTIFHPCQNKFTNKHGRYIIKPSLCTIDGQKTKFIVFCFTILGSRVFARRQGKCDNLKIKLSLATPWKHTFLKSKQNGLGLLPPKTHTHTHNFRISARSFCPFLI